MIKITREDHECCQGGGIFPLYVLSMEGARFFSTEDTQRLVSSLTTLDEQDVTVVIEWDRNSLELPQLGPDLDIQICSELYLHRQGDMLRFEHDSEDGRLLLFEVYFEIWRKVVERFVARQ